MPSASYINDPIPCTILMLSETSSSRSVKLVLKKYMVYCINLVLNVVSIIIIMFIYYSATGDVVKVVYTIMYNIRD